MIEREEKKMKIFGKDFQILGRKSKKFLKITTAILALAIYSNAGWFFSYYYKNEVMPCATNDFQAQDCGAIVKIAAGPWHWLSDNLERTDMSSEKQTNYFFFGLFWPVMIIINGITWLIWLFFCGGFLKILNIV